jgi:formiminoglutamase
MDLRYYLLMTLDLFAHTTRPDAALLFRRDEAGDPRLGEVVHWQDADYEDASIILLGCPQDEGVRRNGGRVGAAAAPDAIRKWLYRLVAPAGVKLFDLGNTVIQPTLEDTHTLQQQIVRQIIADGKTLISLGGGNDISYPDCAGLAQVEPDLLAFNVDAHFDVRDNTPRNSGTPYRMLLEEGYLKSGKFYELGYQPFAVADSHHDYLRKKGVIAYSLFDLRHRQEFPKLIHKILRETDKPAIFWGIDMDVVNGSEAPGVSAPNALGMTGTELCEITQIAGWKRQSRLIEFTEFNPVYDIDNRTARLTAVAVWHFLEARGWTGG